jgi:hypothetical protein
VVNDSITSPIVTPFVALYQPTYQVVRPNLGRLLYLKAIDTAIREINTVLVNDSRRTTDRTIAIVAQMATYEALFGSRKIYRTYI